MASSADDRAIITHATLVYEGKENYEVFEKKLERMISECEEIKDHGLKYDDGSGKYVTVIFVGGGYYKILCESLGHQGAFCYFPCIYCQVRMNQLAEYESSEPRTLRTISEHSHRSHTDMKFPYTCACCNKVYATPAALNTSHTDANDNQLRIFKQTHKSMKPHVAPLFSWIAPKDRIIDLLHLLLRVVEALWAKTLLVHVTSKEHMLMVNIALHELSGCFIKVSKASRGPYVTSYRSCGMLGSV
eukprot:CAMPEP_0198196808 /NCGR_PEP_ID=MMETSP1445-20131203/247_1 /TAXON_ID=36898 /ORGANISM="Pyramimonas sp., Strain CCMP2087" /LENGTH=244 /DNA_ID=CAMNT_0043865801 /DNA_START=34 /DNA_END=768 /DNA_ORIENTATION=-